MSKSGWRHIWENWEPHKSFRMFCNQVIEQSSIKLTNSTRTLQICDCSTPYHLFSLKTVLSVLWQPEISRGSGGIKLLEVSGRFSGVGPYPPSKRCLLWEARLPYRHPPLGGCPQTSLRKNNHCSFIIFANRNHVRNPKKNRLPSAAGWDKINIYKTALLAVFDSLGLDQTRIMLDNYHLNLKVCRNAIHLGCSWRSAPDGSAGQKSFLFFPAVLNKTSGP